MKGLSGFNLSQHQEVISDFIYHIRFHLANSGQEFPPQLELFSKSPIKSLDLDCII